MATVARKAPAGVGPGNELGRPIRSTNRWSLTHPRRRTSSSRIIAVWAAGLPNAIVPSFRNSSATSRTVPRCGQSRRLSPLTLPVGF